DVLRRPALVGDGLGDLRRLDHVNRVPRAPALAQRTTDAPVQVDVAERLERWHVLAGHLVDAIHRADLDAGFAAGAVVGPDDGELREELLLRLGGWGRGGHERSLVREWMTICLYYKRHRPERQSYSSRVLLQDRLGGVDEEPQDDGHGVQPRK